MGYSNIGRILDQLRRFNITGKPYKIENNKVTLYDKNNKELVTFIFNKEGALEQATYTPYFALQPITIYVHELSFLKNHGTIRIMMQIQNETLGIINW